MTDILVVRQSAEGVWQWRLADSRNGWRDEHPQSGDLEALGKSLPRPGTSAYYLVPGERVVTQRVPVEARERRHLAKLVPYQLEDQAIDPVDELHFSLGPLQDNKVAVGYTRLEDLGQDIAALESAGCEVVQCVPDFLMLERDQDTWTLYADDERLLVHSGEGLGLAVDLGLAGPALMALAQGKDRPSLLRLVANDTASMEKLNQLLPEALAVGENLEVERQEMSYWDLIDWQRTPVLDFRSGALARRLPLTRWWREWRVPAIAAAAAFVIAIGVTGAQVWREQRQMDDIMADMRAVYRQAVPNAGENIADPERRLQSLVSGLGSGQAATNFMYLLDETAPAIEGKEGLRISSFRYTSENRELQLNLEAEDFSQLESLRSDISQRGLGAELLRVSAQGGIHQARMRIVEGGL